MLACGHPRPSDFGIARYLGPIDSTPTVLSNPIVNALRDLLPGIQTPVQIVAGRRDAVVPPVNAAYLHQRLPHSELHLLDSGHFVWEDAAEQYAALLIAWWTSGYKTSMTTPTDSIDEVLR
jgi:pimeloyl-ACP methyl ester carboxylesterase